MFLASISLYYIPIHSLGRLFLVSLNAIGRLARYGDLRLHSAPYGFSSGLFLQRSKRHPTPFEESHCESVYSVRAFTTAPCSRRLVWCSNTAPLYVASMHMGYGRDGRQDRHRRGRLERAGHSLKTYLCVLVPLSQLSMVLSNAPAHRTLAIRWHG